MMNRVYGLICNQQVVRSNRIASLVVKSNVYNRKTLTNALKFLG